MVPPVSVAIDKAGHFAAAADLGGGNQDGVKCGLPNLMRSPTGAQWTTCAPNTKGVTTADPGYPVIAFAGNDKLYQVFRTRRPGAGCSLASCSGASPEGHAGRSGAAASSAARAGRSPPSSRTPSTTGSASTVPPASRPCGSAATPARNSRPAANVT